MLEEELIPVLEEHHLSTTFQLKVVHHIFNKLKEEAYRQIDFRIGVTLKEMKEYVLDKTAHAVDKCAVNFEENLLLLERQSKELMTKIWLENLGNLKNLAWESKVICLEARIQISEFKENFDHCETTEDLTFEELENCLEDLLNDLEWFEDNVYKTINTAEKESQEKINNTGQYIGVESERIFHETIDRSQNILDEFLTCDLQKIKKL